jgi:hypothetical protein
MPKRWAQDLDSLRSISGAIQAVSDLTAGNRNRDASVGVPHDSSLAQESQRGSSFRLASPCLHKQGAHPYSRTAG